MEHISEPSTPFKPVCRLLGLPRELRDRIYEHALVVGTIELSCPNPPCRELRVHTTVKPAVGLLETCTQIFEEAGPLFYSRNVFFFREETSRAAKSFFGCRSARTMGWIKNIKFEICRFPDYRDLVFEPCMTIAQHQLPALEHLSLLFSCWPLDDIQHNRHAFIIQGIDQPEPGTDRCPFDAWFKISRKYKRVSMEIMARPDPDCWLYRFIPTDPASLIACAEIFRSLLLRGGENLGRSNITVHSRHTVSRFVEDVGRNRLDGPEDPAAVVYMRSPRRYFIVRCDDDENGRSHLKPLQRLSPLWIDKAQAAEFLGCTIDDVEEGNMFRCQDTSYASGPQLEKDYAESDGGDNDSLKELDVDDINLEPESLKQILEDLSEEYMLRRLHNRIEAELEEEYANRCFTGHPEWHAAEWDDTESDIVQWGGTERDATEWDAAQWDDRAWDATEEDDTEEKNTEEDDTEWASLGSQGEMPVTEEELPEEKEGETA
ncbi:hypothetical protein HDK90DRAFT_470789 [Phyllosticta capitalensis]|uniref:Uncharacterized protein n=1 Tax=Phyllosticta capitalensis TaxID=121624 RepID=A0ABR1Y979_9PEZI